MEREELLKEIQNGRFFSVTFIKRTNGELRKLNGRFGVTKGLKFGPPPYDDADYGLVTVWDNQAKGFRKVPADAIKELKCNRKIWKPE